jgi:hypothetical protein
VLAVCAIAAIHAWLAVSTFAAAFALGDARLPTPAWLSIAANILTLPGFLIAGPRLQALIGDPAEIYLAAAIDGLLWGVAIVALTVWWRRRRAHIRAEASVHS